MISEMEMEMKTLSCTGSRDRSVSPAMASRGPIPPGGHDEPLGPSAASGGGA